MNWLTQERCNRCYIKLKDASQTHCLNCKADLSVVGRWSEFQEWQETRKKGCVRYVLWRALVFAAPLTIGLHARSIWSGSIDWIGLGVTLLIGLLTGFVASFLMWRGIEKEFLTELDRREAASSQPDHTFVESNS